MNNKTTIKPVVGMGATFLAFTDRTPFTVIEVAENGKTCKVQEDTSTRTDSNGMSECQEYTYAPNPKGAIYTLSLRKDGRWRVRGDTMLFSIGERRRYHDYSF